jgi:hypothetical protein
MPLLAWRRCPHVASSPHSFGAQLLTRPTVTHCARVQLAAGRPKLTVRPPQPAVAGGEGEEGRPARVGGLEGLAASMRIGRTQVLELLLEKFYDKR